MGLAGSPVAQVPAPSVAGSTNGQRGSTVPTVPGSGCVCSGGHGAASCICQGNTEDERRCWYHVRQGPPWTWRVPMHSCMSRGMCPSEPGGDTLWETHPLPNAGCQAFVKTSTGAQPAC